MKKMRTVNLIATAIAICAIFSLNAFAQNTPSCGFDVTNLSLTVDNSSGNAITSDGNTAAYATGKTKGDTITAMFQVDNCSQDFTLNLNFSKRFMNVIFPSGGGSYQAKFYNFDRVASVPITPTDFDASTNFVNNSQFCTASPEPLGGFVVGMNPDGTYRDNYAGCAVDSSGKAYVKRNVGINLGGNFRLRYQFSPIDSPGGNLIVAGSSYIRVYHPDANTWVLTPDIATSSLGTKMEYVNNSAFISLGNYMMPFSFTLRKVG